MICGWGDHTSCWKRLKISKTAVDKGIFEKKIVKAKFDLVYFNDRKAK